MAYQNKIIRNMVTGQQIVFLQTTQDTNGQLLEIEATYSAQSKEPIEHYHPCQTEDFTVLSGELEVKIAGAIKRLQKGDTLHIAPGVRHAMWNSTTQTTVVNWKVHPAFNTEYLFETMTGLANDGKVNWKGMPSILQTALTANRFSKVMRLSKPPYAIQKMVFTLLTPVAYLLGYRPVYKKYFR